MRIPSAKVDQSIYFVALDATDHVTRETGLSSFTVYRSRNGAAEVAYTTPTIVEIDLTNMPGVYALLIDEDTTIGASSDSEEYCVHITHAGMAPVTRTIELYRRDTTSGRTLDVSAGGEAGLDWANIGSPTTAVNLSATNIDVDQVVASVSGAVASVTGAVGSVTGNVGGNVTGSVGSVATGGITTASFAAGAVNAAAIGADAITAAKIANGAIDAATFAAGAIDATAIANGAIDAATFAAGAIDAAAIAADAGTEIGTAVWATTTRLLTAGTNIVLAKGTGVTGFNDLSAAQVNTEADTAIADAALATTNDVDIVNDAVSIVMATTDKLDTALELDGAVYRYTTNALEQSPAGGTPPTAAAIADAVWDEAIAGHAGAGSTGEALSAAGGAGDPWITALPGAYSAGQAGFIVGTNLNATVSSRATQTSLDTVDDFLDTEINAIKTKTDFLPSATAGSAGGVFIAGTNAATTVTTSFTTTFTGNLTGSVGSVTGAVGSVTGAVGSVTGNVGGNVTGTVGSVVGAVGSVTGNVSGNVTGTIGGLTAAALKDFFDTDSATTYASAVAGSVVKEIADNAGGGTPPTAAAIADAVWDEAIAGHLGAGSTGLALNSAGSAGDPWITALPGAYGAGTAGKIIGDNINATISSRASQTGLDTVDDFLDTEITDIRNRLPAALVSGRMDASVGAMAANVLTATAINADAITDAKVASDVTIASVTGAVGSVTGAVGSVTGAVGSVGAGGITAASFAADAITAAKVAADVGTEIGTAVWATTTRILTALDEDTTTLDLDATIRAAVGLASANLDTQIGDLPINAELATALGTADDAVLTAINDLPTNAELATALGTADDAVLAAVAALNNLSAAQVNAEVVDALNVDTYAEPGQGAPAATASLAVKINYIFKAWRNRVTQTSSIYALYADDATTVDQKATVADDGTTFSRTEIASGP